LKSIRVECERVKIGIVEEYSN